MAISPQDCVARSLMYSKYTTLSAPCPAKKWPMAMGIRIVVTGPSLRARQLALHSNRSYGYAFRSRAALTNTNPAPAPVIQVRNAG